MILILSIAILAMGRRYNGNYFSLAFYVAAIHSPDSSGIVYDRSLRASSAIETSCDLL
jgi:hypothetical protein